MSLCGQGGRHFRCLLLRPGIFLLKAVFAVVNKLPPSILGTGNQGDLTASPHLPKPSRSSPPSPTPSRGAEMDNLTATEMKELETRMQKRQVKEFVGLFSNLVDHCFMSCIEDFTSKSLSSRETGCVARCVQKDMAAAQRLSERFQEHNAAQMANQQQR
ncbi:hypothetical protein GGTG_01030 [Gaeumannomyces tritici R3-111a-1]|uniref:Mitochondrial import inner membrane translocase subunit TIM9 n=1 Tax=Gaeumannomyces tritici (strain R3-111a-1) TaxID=644352 RepID=J3NIE9_GAET3|nr:hypothetical protein GGTG_01030 [Gaeumannomyces tritici R3-111a-1]EJT81042.1 hypothetical protein GGTG_01030 [Gaeumannomyces tritici R3-111a-1]